MPQQPNLNPPLSPGHGSGNALSSSQPAQDGERRCQQLETECKQLEQAVQALTEERDRLRKQLAQAETDRDRFLQSLYVLMPNTGTFTEAELLDLQQHGVPLEQTIAEIEQLRGT